MDIRALHTAIDTLQMPEGPIRISAAHLVPEIRIKGSLEKHYPAMLSVGMHVKNNRRFDAIGGGVELHARGCKVAKEWHEASDISYSRHDKAFDARFIVPNAMYARGALDWLGDLEWGKRGLFEFHPHREVYGELSGTELQGIKPGVPPDDPEWRDITYTYLGVALQPPTEAAGDTSTMAGKMPTRRLFHQWRMLVSERFFEKLQTAESIHFLSFDALCSTKGGRQQGRLEDGTPLGNNLGVNLTVKA